MATTQLIQTTKVVIDPGDPEKQFTLVNEGADTLYYRERSDAALAGTAAEIVVLGGSGLAAGRSVVVDGSTWDVVCATAASATLLVLPGAMSASIDLAVSGITVNSDLDSLGGSAINVNSGNKDNGTQVVNQATNGVIGTAFGAVGATAAKDGVFHAQFEYIATQLDNLELLLAVGEGAKASAQAVTLATDDTQLGTASSTSAVAGDLHGKLRYIGTQLEANLANAIVAGNGLYIRQSSGSTMALETGGNLASILAVLNGTTASLTEKVPTWLAVVVGTPGTPIAFAADGTFATYIGVEAKLVGGSNTGTAVFIAQSTGATAVDKDTWQGHALGPGDTWEYRAPPGTKFDLNDFGLDGATTTDGIIIVYTPA